MPLKGLKTFLENLWVTEGEGFRIKDRAKTSFLDWLIHESKLEIDTLNRLARTFESLFDELESEYRGVRINQLDPRFMRLFWLKSINGLLPKRPLP